MMHATNNFDGELVSVKGIRLDNGKYRADFTLTKSDGSVIENFAAMGTERKQTRSQELCEKMGAMPYSKGHESVFPFEAIIKSYGNGNSFVLDKLVIDDELVECIDAVDLLKSKPGSIVFMWHDKQWMKIVSAHKGYAPGTMDIKLYDPRLEKPEHYPVNINRYCKTWIVVRYGNHTESEAAA